MELLRKKTGLAMHVRADARLMSVAFFRGELLSPITQQALAFCLKSGSLESLCSEKLEEVRSVSLMDLVKRSTLESMIMFIMRACKSTRSRFPTLLPREVEIYSTASALHNTEDRARPAMASLHLRSR